MTSYYPLQFNYNIMGEVARNMYDCNEDEMIKVAKDAWITCHKLPEEMIDKMNVYVSYDSDWDIFNIRANVLVSFCY